MIWICQYLCPSRHCIVGMAYEPDEYLKKDIEHMLSLTFANGMIEEKCGICGSQDLKYEHAATIFHTMDEAGPEIGKLQLNNLASRTAIDQIKQNAQNN